MQIIEKFYKPKNIPLTRIVFFVLTVVACLWFLFAILYQQKYVGFTADEPRHIFSGYQYYKTPGINSNPEHPPLVKMISAIPLLFMNISASDIVNPGIYNLDKERPLSFVLSNGALKLLWLARIGPLVLALMGFIIYWIIITRIYSFAVGALSCFFLVFSPTFLAHSYLVTNDVAAAFLIFAGFWVWYKWILHSNSGWKIIGVGLVWGVMLLTKFSVFIIVPITFFLTILWGAVNVERVSIGYWVKLIARFCGAFFISMGFVYLFYIGFGIVSFILPYSPPHLWWGWGMPKSWYSDLVGFSSQYVFLRPITHYFSGLLIALSRSRQNSEVFFLGKQVVGWNPWYFPTVYFIKESYWFHITSFVAAILILFKIAQKYSSISLKKMIQCNFFEVSMAVFIIVYAGIAISSGLNIGIRHLLPIFPFIFLLVARGLYIGYSLALNLSNRSFLIVFVVGCVLLMGLQAVEVIRAGPLYLPFSNLLIGGPCQTHKYLEDSNLDWGQISWSEAEHGWQGNIIPASYIKRCISGKS